MWFLPCLVWTSCCLFKSWSLVDQHLVEGACLRIDSAECHWHAWSSVLLPSQEGKGEGYGLSSCSYHCCFGDRRLERGLLQLCPLLDLLMLEVKVIFLCLLLQERRNSFGAPDRITHAFSNSFGFCRFGRGVRTVFSNLFWSSIKQPLKGATAESRCAFSIPVICHWAALHWVLLYKDRSTEIWVQSCKWLTPRAWSKWFLYQNETACVNNSQ